MKKVKIQNLIEFLKIRGLKILDITQDCIICWDEILNCRVEILYRKTEKK